MPELHCIRCGAVLNSGQEAAEARGVSLGSPPLGALLFYAHGSDVSRAYNPGPGTVGTEHLVIGICDECLVQAGDADCVAHGSADVSPGLPLPGTWSYSRWFLPGSLERQNGTGSRTGGDYPGRLEGAYCRSRRLH